MTVRDDRISSFLVDFNNCIMCHSDADTDEFDENRWLRPSERGSTLISVDLERNLVALVNALKPGLGRKFVDISKGLDSSIVDVLDDYIKEFEDFLIRSIENDIATPPLPEQEIQCFWQLIFMYSILVCFMIKICAIQINNLNFDFTARYLGKLSETFETFSQKGYLDDRAWNAIPNWTLGTNINEFLRELNMTHKI